MSCAIVVQWDPDGLLMGLAFPAWARHCISVTLALLAQPLCCRAADVAFYGGSGAVIAMLGSQPSARAARLPLAALLLCNWAAEHWLLNTFERCSPYLTQSWSTF